jgi:hypothetical protein
LTKTTAAGTQLIAASGLRSHNITIISDSQAGLTKTTAAGTQLIAASGLRRFVHHRLALLRLWLSLVAAWVRKP